MSVLALHLDECGPPGLALGEAYMDDVAKVEDRESNEVIGFLLCRLDFKIVAIVRKKVKERSEWGAAKESVLVSMFPTLACLLQRYGRISYKCQRNLHLRSYSVHLLSYFKNSYVDSNYIVCLYRQSLHLILAGVYYMINSLLCAQFQ